MRIGGKADSVMRFGGKADSVMRVGGHAKWLLCDLAINTANQPATSMKITSATPRQEHGKGGLECRITPSNAQSLR